MDYGEDSDDLRDMDEQAHEAVDEAPLSDHPLLHLDMELIEACTLIVPMASVPLWTAEGWVELPGYVDFHYAAGEEERVIARRPDTLATRGALELLGAEIAGWCTSLGTYGMGGPGFFGLLPPPRAGVAYREYLVFAAWGAEEYVLLDDRVLDTHPRYRAQYRPWRAGDDGGRAALDVVLIGARIAAAEVADDHQRVTLSQGGRWHVLECVRNDPRLPPFGGGGPREQAFKDGVIAAHSATATRTNAPTATGRGVHNPVSALSVASSQRYL